MRHVTDHLTLSDVEEEVDVPLKPSKAFVDTFSGTELVSSIARRARREASALM